MGIILFLVARLLQWVLTPVFFVYAIVRYQNLKKISKYFHDVAFAIDQLGNVMGAPIMNDVLIKNQDYPFGNPDHTISHVLGVNYTTNNLTFWGVLLCKILNFLDKDHVQKAALSEQ
jgi:hypothetical protein